MAKPTTNTESGLYIALISVHGLIRGSDLELGRDADTGGQTKYVVELARALAEHEDVERVDLFTRQVIDAKVSPDYAQPSEDLGGGAAIVRLPCGPRRYLRKEVLWPHLDVFIDNAVQYISALGRSPDAIHSHYADAGHVGARLAQLLGVPLVHTGHSLGRVKRERLLANKVKPEVVESQYNMSQRIEAEEITLGNAELVVASTSQEVREQYSQYENYHTKRMVVIPPGTDLTAFRPPRPDDPTPAIAAEVGKFLRDPGKPMILALSRPDERKNIATLVRAYGENRQLQELANLVIVAGNRDDVRTMERGPREVLTDLLLLIDRHDLYGRVAYPKHHHAEDVPDLYRLAAQRQGVFVNPALTEPFGLTLIEAAASALPVVATRDGGPMDIMKRCDNGVLIDPLNARAMGRTLVRVLSDQTRWKRWSDNGCRCATAHYSWGAHVETYLQRLRKVLGPRPRTRPLTRVRSRMPSLQRLVVCDVDSALVGDRDALATLLERIRATQGRIGLGVVTGRGLQQALPLLKDWGVPTPDLLITSVGSEIHYGHNMIKDDQWERHIDYRWKPAELRAALGQLPGLRQQPAREQGRFKLSYQLDPKKNPGASAIRAHLRHLDLHAKLIYSHERYLDVLPVRASKGLALRYLAFKWGLAPEAVLVAGGTGSDEEPLCGSMLGVVVSNHYPELQRLRGRARVYFAAGAHAAGVLEGLDYYDFLGTGRIPDEQN